MLEDFTAQDVDVDGTRIHAVVAGEGPPVLLLHGYPQNHRMWHRVAPALAQSHTVVLADLRGTATPRGRRPSRTTRRTPSARRPPTRSA